MRSTYFVALCMFGLIAASSATSATCKTDNSPTTPLTDFAGNGNGTVTHTVTGLTWKVCAEGLSGNNCGEGKLVSSDWKDAMAAPAAANAARFGGHSDWRLPNIKELFSIVETSCFNPSANEKVFPGSPANWMWSATSLTLAPGEAWGVNFGSGYVFPKNKQAAYGNIRLVRGGLGESGFDAVSSNDSGPASTLEK